MFSSYQVTGSRNIVKGREASTGSPRSNALSYTCHPKDFMKNAVFWDLTPYDTCKNRRFGGRIVLWWRRYVLPKCRFLHDPHGVISQKTAFFIVTAMKTSNLTKYFMFYFLLLLFNSVKRKVTNITTAKQTYLRHLQRRYIRKDYLFKDRVASNSV
jgi:hypothetical protein